MRTASLLIALVVLGVARCNSSSDTLELNGASATKNEQPSSISNHHRRQLQQSSMQPQARVVNGWVADDGQFPYAGYLSIEGSCISTIPSTSKTTSSPSQDVRYSSICASSLIMPRVLVSAGHCLFKCTTKAPSDALPGEVSNSRTEINTWSGPISVKLNQLNVSEPTSQVPGAEERFITGATRNPEYVSVDSLPLANDISLLWFDTPSEVTPAQLSLQETFTLGQSFMVAGWGYTNPNRSSLSDVLRTAVVPYVPLDVCSAKYGTPISQGDICAGANPANFADSCAGDSGGPLVMNVTANMNKNTCVGCADQQLVGLTSYGESCANSYPGVYTNVPMQADWIDQTITLSNAGGLQKPAIGCSSHVGQRYHGRQNSTLFSIPNPAQCCNACKVNGTTTCRGWSWHKSTKRCVLIRKVESRTLTTTWTSGNTTGTLPAKSSTCELEFYVQYTDVAGTQILKKCARGSTPTESAQQCCSACQQNPNCRNMSYNKVLKTCTLFKGPSRKTGWGRKAWQYNYVSGLVSRRP